jgi:hypothetical protein
VLVIVAGRSAPPLDLVPPPARWTRSDTWPRWIAILLAAWLFASAFMWPHTRGALGNETVFGALMLGCGIVALYVRFARWVEALFAIALAIATLTTAHLVAATLWSGLAVALGVFVTSFIDGE